jgi:MazG family protein
VAVQKRLRAPQGCPWDREQTHATLRPYLIEEAYEVLDALDAGDDAKFAEEMGDLLLQVVFHSEIARAEGRFSIADVVKEIHDKMVRRHPHVFGDANAGDSAEVLRNWEAIKAEEKRAAGKDTGEAASILDGVSTKAPALMEAHQISTKVARVGFDWKDVEEIFAKMNEELDELRAAITAHAETNEEADHAHVREEIGDLLFVITNIARRFNVEPEAALKLSNRKFRQRFRFIEDRLREQQKKFDDVTIEDLEALWQEAKRA